MARTTMRLLTCGECGRKYETLDSHKGHRFCSRRCAGIASNRGRPERTKTLTCVTCGKTFTMPQSMPAKYCSRTCYRQRPTKFPRTFLCEYCGKQVMRRYPGGNGARKRSARFCSSRCRGLAERRGYVTTQGYREIAVDGAKRGMMLEHRSVMERILGRELLSTESVHHKNGDRLGNRPDNLELWD